MDTWMENVTLRGIKQYLRIDEVAEILRVSNKTIGRYIKEGRIDAVSLNQGRKGIRIIAESVEKYQTNIENVDKTDKNDNIAHQNYKKTGVGWVQGWRR